MTMELIQPTKRTMISVKFVCIRCRSIFELEIEAARGAYRRISFSSPRAVLDDHHFSDVRQERGEVSWIVHAQQLRDL
jgi:hypothetical protein